MSIQKKTFTSDVSAERYITGNLYENGVLRADSDVRVEMVDIEFHEQATDIIDVYVGRDTTYVVVDNLDFQEILIFKMSTVEYYSVWELFIRKDLYFQEDHSNEWVWFNIGQKGDYFVTWHCAIINGNFDVDSIRFEGYEEDDEGNDVVVWVKHSDDRRVGMHHSVKSSFDDLEKVAELVKTSYWEERDVHVEGRNYLHIYDIFDMDDVNKYGIGRALWG